MKKRIIGIVLSLALCLMLGGCMNRTQEVVEEEMLAYMQEKYGEKFSFTEFYGSHIGSATRTAYVTSEKCPDAKITVTREVEDGTVALSDDYPLFLYEEELMALAENATNAVYGDCRVLYVPMQSSVQSETKTSETLDEVLAQSTTKIGIVVLLSGAPSEDERNEKAELYRQTLKEQGLRARVTLLYTEDAADFDLEDDALLRDMSLDDRFAYVGSFSMDKSYEFLHLKWR